MAHYECGAWEPEKGKNKRVSVPEGHLMIAQRFIAGLERRSDREVP